MHQTETRNPSTLPGGFFRQYRFTREESALISLAYPDLRDFEQAAETDRWLPCRVLPFYSLRRCDWAARRTGDTPETSPWHISRQKSAIWKALLAAEADGHCWTDWQELKDTAEVTWREDDDFAWHDDYETGTLDMSAAIKELVSAGECTYHKFKDCLAVSRSELADQEKHLAEVFGSAGAPNPCFPGSAQTQDLSNFNLVPEQEEAVRKTLSNSISLISGPAGSGKSYTLTCVDALCRDAGKKVVMCAPTGKAARRMEEISGQKAMTVHRLLGYNGTEFRADRENPISADALIVDEFSMMSTELTYRLMDAVNLSRTSVLLVGDHNQLPPVGAGNPIRDLLKWDAVPKTVLTKVLRHAGDLKKCCTGILSGNVSGSVPAENGRGHSWKIETDLEDPEAMSERILELAETELGELGYDFIEDTQILIPRKQGKGVGVDEMNAKLQKLAQKKLYGRDILGHKPGQSVFYQGDKVIQTRNNYRLGDNGIMNGTIGRVKEVEPGQGTLMVDFGESGTAFLTDRDKKDLSLAYALTVHKAQGSEFPCAVLVLHPAHSWKLHHRNLFYTGVTRAKERVFVLGSKMSIDRCAKTIETAKRRTLMPYYAWKASKTAAS